LDVFSKTALTSGDAISLLGEKIGHVENEVDKHLASPSSFAVLGSGLQSLSEGLTTLEAQTVNLSSMLSERQLPLDAALLSATSGFKSLGDQVSVMEELGPNATLLVQQLKAIAASAAHAADNIARSQERIPAKTPLSRTPISAKKIS
jgi:hypothetical protein